MLLFIYLCDNCDIAGFIEINYKRWATDLNSTISTLEGACKGLARGLIWSKESDCIFIKNFLKHQKNLPLNENNKAHLGILKRFEIYKYKFDIENVNEFIEGACKGLLSPTGNGNGNGISNGNDKKEETEKSKFKIPELFEIESYFKENGYSNESAEKFYAYYEAGNWIDGKGQQVKNWKQKAQAVWFKPENKIRKAKYNGVNFPLGS